MALGGLDNDGARRSSVRRHRRLPEFRIQLHEIIGDQTWLVAGVRLSGLRLALRGRTHQSNSAGITIQIEYRKTSSSRIFPRLAPPGYVHGLPTRWNHQIARVGR